MSDKKAISLGEVKYNLKNEQHTPSTIQADTLFTFTTQLDYLFQSIQNKMISPRYCEEDIKYLKIRHFKRIAYPMKCFCDINLHRLGAHLEWYGYYGLAFSKKWGMDHGIQPVQYINPKSELCKDFSYIFNAMLKTTSKSSSLENKMKSFILHEMMYYKPYDGKFKNRNTNKLVNKCFTDECEWRFIPDVTVLGYEQAYFDNEILNAGSLINVSNSMINVPQVSIQFDYSDLKYIIIKTSDDLNKIIDNIEKLEFGKAVERELISKIIVWDNSKEDF